MPFQYSGAFTSVWIPNTDSLVIRSSSEDRSIVSVTQLTEVRSLQASISTDVRLTVRKPDPYRGL